MGIEPTVFGPYMWATIHYVALGAPATFDEKDKVKYKTFYGQLPGIIPCATCSEHFIGVLNKYPIDAALRSSAELFQWTVTIHNDVNTRLGKPVMTIEEARNRWNRDVSKKEDGIHNTIPISICAVFLLCGLVWYFYSVKGGSTKSGKSFRA